MKQELTKTDVLIIGGGGAGLAAAVQAAENGAKVTILEKRHTSGGNTAMAHGFFAADSPVQKRMMVDAPKDVLFKLALDYHHWTINPRLVRSYMNKSAETVGWLEAKGLKISILGNLSPYYFYRTFHMGEGPTGILVVKLLSQKAADLGVAIHTKSDAKKILRDSGGRVKGVLAMTENGEATFEARTVIITTGGYGGNKDLMQKYCAGYSDDINYLGLKDLTGDGLMMAMEAGAATEGLGFPHYWGGHYKGTNSVNLVNQRPEMIWVNKSGERFCDEDIMFDMGLRGNILERQPGNVSFTIFDERIKQQLMTEGPIGAQVALRWSAPDITWEAVLSQLPGEVGKGYVKISDSLDEIAKWMGAPPDVFKATISEYNTDCDKGYDSLFVKQRRFLQPLRNPPYYAVIFQQAMLDTMGGIKTNHHLEILDQNAMPIPGLYAAGVCVGGFTSPSYCYMLGGTMFGFSLNSGRIAADNASRYASVNK
jgi:fumarate reductase flavoprotein subunit